MPRASGLTAEQVAHVLRLIQSGESKRSVAKRLKIARNTVQDISKGTYTPRPDCLGGRPSQRFIIAERCACGAMVVEMYTLSDGSLTCLACAIRSGKADKSTVPMHTNPMISDTLFDYENTAGRPYSEPEQDVEDDV